MSIFSISESDLSNTEYITDEDKEILSRVVVLDLNKISEIIHKILDISSMKEEGIFSKGVFKKDAVYNHLEEYLNNYCFKGKRKDKKRNSDLIDYVLSFMVFNKIIFRLNGSVNDDVVFVSPSYLEDEPPKYHSLMLGLFGKPVIFYEFAEFYHVSIFSDIMTNFKKYISYDSEVSNLGMDCMIWKNKAVFFYNCNNSSAAKPLIYLDFDLGEILGSDITPDFFDERIRKPSIKISVFNKIGYFDKNFLMKVTNFIDLKLKDYNYKKFLIAPNDYDYVDVEALKQNVLNQNNNQPARLFTYNNSLYRVSDFNMFVDSDDNTMKKIFISHSTDDYQEVQEFIKHISPLKRQGLIDDWHCSELVTGASWDAEIQKKLWESDIICLFITASWLANDYVFEKELKTVIDRKEKFKKQNEGKDIIIFPIIVKPCMWTTINFLSSIQAAPQKGKPVSTFADKDQAWVDVVQKLLDVINGKDTHKIGSKLGEVYKNLYEGHYDKYN